MLQEHGVAHAVLPMTLRDQQHDAGAAGVLHVFIKAVHHPRLMEVKGVVYFDAASEIQYCRPKAKRVAPGPWRGNSTAAPGFTITSMAQPGLVITLERVAEDHVTPTTPCMPLLLRANVSHTNGEWQLHVHGVPNVVVPLLDMQPAVQPESTPTFVTMLGRCLGCVPGFCECIHNRAKPTQGSISHPLLVLELVCCTPT